MRVTSLSIGVLGLLLIGGIGSWPRIAEARKQAAHQVVAKERSQRCLMLEQGSQIQEGYFYAGILDPSKKWQQPDGKGGWKPTREGALLGGVNQSLCDSSGMTAEVGIGGVAQNLRSMSAEEMEAALRKRFPTGEVSFTAIAIKSDRFLPDFKKRAEEKKAKAAQENKKIKIIGAPEDVEQTAK